MAVQNCTVDSLIGSELIAADERATCFGFLNLGPALQEHGAPALGLQYLWASPIYCHNLDTGEIRYYSF
jgi:hypothetical protein